MKRTIVAALLCSAVLAHAQSASAPVASSPAKKELVQKWLSLQQGGIENLARNLVEQPAVQMTQAAGRALQQQVPAEKREVVGKGIDADIRKYVDETVPVIRDRAVKLAPSTIGALMEEKFSEDELKQLVAWLESPINKKYMQLNPEMLNTFQQRLVTEARPIVEPRLQALEAKVRTSLGVPAPSGLASAAAAKPAAAAPAKKASAAK
jgi:uncharacterized protein